MDTNEEDSKGVLVNVALPLDRARRMRIAIDGTSVIAVVIHCYPE